VNILVGIYDPCVIAGNVRVMYQLADILAEEQHEIVIKYSNIRPRRARYFHLPTSPNDESDLSGLKEYHPIDALNPRMFEEIKEKDYYWTLERLLDEGDLDFFITGDAGFPYLLEHTEGSGFYYLQWPERPKAPNCTVVANSSFTSREARKRWGVKTEVLHPPIYLDRYNGDLSYEERDIDIMALGQLYRWKNFGILNHLSEDYNVYVIGAKVRDDPELNDDINVLSNLPYWEVASYLSRTKVFVHPTVGEHFGIIVPRGYGVWMSGRSP